MYIRHSILTCCVCKRDLDAAPHGVYHDVVTCSSSCSKVHEDDVHNILSFKTGVISHVRFTPNIKAYR